MSIYFVYLPFKHRPNLNYFRPVIQNLHITLFFNKFNYIGKDTVNVACFIAQTNSPYGCTLPEIVISDFCHGNIKLISGPG